MSQEDNTEEQEGVWDPSRARELARRKKSKTIAVRCARTGCAVQSEERVVLSKLVKEQRASKVLRAGGDSKCK